MSARQPQEEIRSKEVRLGMNVLARRYFMLVRIGEERRDPVRLEVEGQVRVPARAVAYGMASTVFFLLFGIICSLYLLKAMAGINFLSQVSPLHPLYALFFE